MAERTIEQWLQRARGARGAPRPGSIGRRSRTLKAEIGTLFKAVERELNELTTLKAGVLELVEKWKATKNGQPTPVASAIVPTIAPPFSGERPVVHADHIGASTFIEKGWSKISLGDYDGAEAALTKALELSPNDPQSRVAARLGADAPGQVRRRAGELSEGADARAVRTRSRASTSATSASRSAFSARRSSTCRRRFVSTTTRRRRCTRTSISASCISSATCTRTRRPSSRRRSRSGRT